MTTLIVISFVKTVIVAIVIFLLNRIFPPFVKPSDQTMAQLKKEYASPYKLWYSIYVILALVFFGIWLWGFREAWAQRYFKPRVAQYYFHMEWIYWILPSLMLGIVTPAYPLLFVCRMALGKRFEPFMTFFDGRSKFNIRRLLPWASGAIIILNILAYPYGQQYYIAFETDGIRWNPFTTTTEQHYGYDQIHELVRYYPGTGNDDDYYTIEFVDGKIWSTRSLMTSDYSNKYSNLFSYLESKTGQRMKLKPI